ncbi:hypothetical protein SLITO_v1c06210 [Spiroplasma litorale]|uniref:Uncharacterized protein n=1 Tax=Spiroplasma litorale TaxID=216942 RepID=A0A0K1W265_9MOLU|nr:hypothetical protein [Spiroplasma litorale]AKX34253.1 hypothetical protein SLITO_v1c06210 [Spiroplasma litorale]
METWQIVLLIISVVIIVVTLTLTIGYLIHSYCVATLNKYKQIYIDRALEEVNKEYYEFKIEENYNNLMKILSREILDKRSSFKIRDSVINDGPKKRVQLKNIILDKIKLDYNSDKEINNSSKCFLKHTNLINREKQQQEKK